MIKVLAVLILALIVLLVWLLIYIMKNMKRVDRRVTPIMEKGTIYSTGYSSVLVGEKKYVNIHAFELPKGIEKLTHEEEYAASKAIYKVFKAINYKNMEKDFNLKEWHSWQVGILIYKYKRYEEFFIYEPKDIFREEILGLSDINLKKLLNNILIRYQNEVNVKTGTRDMLSEDVRWSAKDVSIILRFLSRYKDFPKELK